MALTWKEVWHRGIVPQLSDKALRILRTALVENDPALIQGETAFPLTRHKAPVEGACIIGYCGWQEKNLLTIREVFTYFDTFCLFANIYLLSGEGDTGIGVFTGWWDSTPREEAIAQLLPEVEMALEERNILDGIESPVFA